MKIKRQIVPWIAFLMACQSADKTPVAKSSSIAVDKTKALFSAFNAHDWKHMASLYSPQAMFLDPSLGQYPVHQTSLQMITKYSELATIIPDLMDSVVYILPCDTNKILVEFVSKGTLPDSSVFRLPITSILTYQNGLIISDHTYYDNSESGE